MLPSLWQQWGLPTILFVRYSTLNYRSPSTQFNSNAKNEHILPSSILLLRNVLWYSTRLSCSKLCRHRTCHICQLETNYCTTCTQSLSISSVTDQPVRIQCLHNSISTVDKWFADVGSGIDFGDTNGVRYWCTSIEELPSASFPMIPVFFTLMEEFSSSVAVLHWFTLRTLAHQCSVSVSHGFSPSGSRSCNCKLSCTTQVFFP